MDAQQLSTQLVDKLHLGNHSRGMQVVDLPTPIGAATAIGYIDSHHTYWEIPARSASWAAARHDGWKIGLVGTDGVFLDHQFVEGGPDREHAAAILARQIDTMTVEVDRRTKLADFANRVATLPDADDRVRAAARCCHLGGSTPGEIAPMIGLTVDAVYEALDALDAAAHR